MEKAGGNWGRDEGDVWVEIGSVGRGHWLEEG